MLLILPDHDHDTCYQNTLLESNKGADLSKNNDDLDTSIWFEYGMSSTKGHNSFNQIKMHTTIKISRSIILQSYRK